jgi:hypothetical protein
MMMTMMMTALVLVQTVTAGAVMRIPWLQLLLQLLMQLLLLQLLLLLLLLALGRVGLGGLGGLSTRTHCE